MTALDEAKKKLRRPDAPAQWEDDEALAVRSLLRDESHRKAVDWILQKACLVNDSIFRGEDESGERGTSFIAGRRFVALQIMKMASDEVGKSIAQRVKKDEEAKT